MKKKPRKKWKGIFLLVMIIPKKIESTPPTDALTLLTSSTESTASSSSSSSSSSFTTITSTRPRKLLLKIIILGDSGVGKTAILNRYVHNRFTIQYKATIGADFLTKEAKLNDKIATLQMWDTTGQERFCSLGIAFYRGSDAVIYVYDPNVQASFDNLSKWKSEFDANAAPREPLPIVIVANKSAEGVPPVVAASKGEELAKNWNATFVQTSAKEGSVDVIFDSLLPNLFAKESY